MRSSAFRAAFRTCSIFGTQLFVSATVFNRSQNLPPSEMKSLYGSITRSAVMSLSNFRPAMFVSPIELLVLMRQGHWQSELHYLRLPGEDVMVGIDQL